MKEVVLLAFFLLINSPDFSLEEARNITIKPVIEETSFVQYYNIPLNKDIQKYIYKQAEKYNISYELLLAIAYTESKFNSKAISYNDTSLGLFQINKYNTLEWLAKETGIDNVDPFNPYHSTKMAAFYIAYLRDYYLKRGYDEENVTNRVLLAYNMGLAKSKKWVKRYGLISEYVRDVLDYKYKLESGEIE